MKNFFLFRFESFRRAAADEKRLVQRLVQDSSLRRSLDSRLEYQNVLRHSFAMGDTSINEVVTALRTKNEKSGPSAPPSGKTPQPSYRQLQDELRSLRSELSNCREAAQREQYESLLNLDSLRTKFERLLASHNENQIELQKASAAANGEGETGSATRIVLQGVLKSLVVLSLLPETLARDLITQSLSSFVRSDDVYTLVGDHLNQFVSDLNSHRLESERLLAENKRLTAAALHRPNGKDEQEDLMETSAEIEDLHASLEEIKRSSTRELDKMQAAAAAREDALRESFENEFTLLRRGFESKLEALTSSLRGEKKRRKEVQQMLSSKEEALHHLFAKHEGNLQSLAVSSPKRGGVSSF